MRRRSVLTLAITAAVLTGCGTATLDLAGYPDASRERLYRNGRLGGDNGLINVDLRKVWQAVD